MARENPIHNGRLETDLDANNHTIKNLPADFSPLSPATADTLGGVKVGSGLSVTQDGTLSANKDNTKLDAASAADDWEGDASTYQPGSAVSYNGKTYLCTESVRSSTPPSEDYEHWEVCVLATEIANAKESAAVRLRELAAASEWTNRTFAEDDYVVYDGYVYKCKVKIDVETGKAPPDDLWDTSTEPATGHWLLVPIMEELKSLLAGKFDKTGGEVTGDISCDNLMASSIVQAGIMALDGENNQIVLGGTTIVDGEIQVSGGNYSFDGDGGSVAVLAQIGIKAFDTSTAYAVGDHVIYATTAGNETTYSLYRCTTAHSAGTWDAGHFTKVADLNTAAPASGGTSLITNGQVFAALAPKANASDLRYALVTKTIANDTVTLDDRASNVVVVPEPASGATEVTLTLNLPAAVSGKARDLLVRLDLTNVPTTGVGISGISFAPASGETATFEVKGNAWPENEVGKVNLWSFTETKDGSKWAVGRETLTAVTQGGGS